MSGAGSASDLSRRLGYQFVRAELLEEALTHPSLSNGQARHNQRLEFLGDRVLGLVISEALIHHDPEATEGQLAPRFNAMVRKETCAAVARQVELGPALRMGRSEMLSGGRKKTAMLGDAMEAVIAAVYLDGGLEAARDMVLRLWGDRIARAEGKARDPKTALQEWAQARGMQTPHYEVVARDGPDHAPEFTIRVELDNGVSAQAQATSKRAAQQMAADLVLKELGE